MAFIVTPLAIDTLLRMWLIARHGRQWFEQYLLPKFGSITMLALLATLVCIFAFQAAGTPEERAAVFKRVRDEIAASVRKFIQKDGQNS